MVIVQDISDIGITAQSSIWLYRDIGYFVDMFEEAALPVDKESKYVENYTGVLPSDDCFTNVHPNTNRIIRDRTCLCEFYSTAGDTYTSWAQHRPNRVAIQTSVDRLCKGLSEDTFRAYIVPVTNYCQLSAVSISPDNSTRSKISVSDFVSQFSYKDQNYTQEQVIRLVGVHAAGIDNSFFNLRKMRAWDLSRLEYMSANLDNLIGEIVISPHAGDWVAKMLQEYIKEDFGLTDCVRQSSLS